MNRQPFRKTLPGKLVMTVAALAACYLVIDASLRASSRGYEDAVFIMGTFVFVLCPLVIAMVVTIHFLLRRHREHDGG